MISNKQSQFYLLPAMVPFIIGFAVYLFPFLEWMDEKISERTKQVVASILNYGGSAIIAVCIFSCFFKAGTVVRERNLLNDLQCLNALSKNESVIGADMNFREDWYLRGYLLRLYRKRIALPDEKIATQFYLTLPNADKSMLPVNLKKVMSGKTFDLYQTL